MEYLKNHFSRFVCKKKECLIEGGATNLQNPVGSTILFEVDDQPGNLTSWDKVLNDEFKDDIYFYLCSVTQYSGFDFQTSHNWDTQLNANFQAKIITKF